MNETSAIISLFALVFLTIVYYIYKRQKSNNIPSEQKPQPHHHQDSEECCGQHEVCDKEKQLQTLKSLEYYYDDEELDNYKGRSADSYNDKEIDEFRYILETMKQEEIKNWINCLQIRGIELPNEIKEEVIMLLED